MLRVLYAGSPEASAVTLSILLDRAPGMGFEVAGVLTNPPAARGRHTKACMPTEVEAVARAHNIPVFNPEHLDAACREAVSSINPDILVCFAYGHIFGPKFLDLFQYGGINLHPSALPEYRGCTPVNAAILNRNSHTAYTIQKLSPGMDEGDILAQQDVILTGKETAGSLLHTAAVDGAGLILNVLEAVSQNGVLPQGKKQEGIPSYTGIIRKQDALIDWKQPAAVVDSTVRGYYPEPAAWTHTGTIQLNVSAGFYLDDDAGKELGGSLDSCPGTVSYNKSAGILVRCGMGFYVITQLQKPGKKATGYKDFMNGARDFIGSVLQ